MSFFKNLFKETLKEVTKPTIKTPDYFPNKSPITSKYLKEEWIKNRRQSEEKAWEIHPVLGSGLQTLNNIGDTIDNLSDSLENGITRALFAKEVDHLAIGDHLFVQRVGYTHHGIYTGEGRVVHYLRERICEDSLTTFANGAKIQKKTEEESPLSYSKAEAAARAKRRVGESDYNLIIRNCESFVRWCRNGLDSWS